MISSRVMQSNRFHVIIYEKVPFHIERTATGDWDVICPSDKNGGNTKCKDISRHIGYDVWHSEIGDLFLVLEERIVEEHLVWKVLHNNRVGWIIWHPELGLEELRP